MKRYLSFVAGLFLVLLGLYWATSTPDPAGYGDSDELLAVSFLGGVAHPPGYPLLTLIAGVVMRVFSNVEPAYVGNIFNGLLAALGWGFSAWGLLLIVGVKTRFIKLLTCLGVWFAGTTYLVWMLATVMEVAGLSLFLAGVLLFCLGQWQAAEGKQKTYWSLGVAGVFGLLVGHYQPAFLLGPGLAYMYWVKGREEQKPLAQQLISWGWVVSMSAVGFGVGQIPLWFQAQSLSPVSWYMEPSFKGLVNQVMRADYGRESFEQGREFAVYVDTGSLFSGKMLEGVGRYFYWLWQHMSLGLALAGAGFYWLWQRKRAWFWTFGWWFILSGVLFGGYVLGGLGGTQETYFESISLRQLVLSEWVVGIVGGFGLVWAGRLLKRRGWAWVGLSLGAGLVGLNLWLNLPSITNSTTKEGVALYALEALEQAADDSLIICTSDIDCFSLFYASEVLGVREDVLVIPHMISYRVGYLKNNTQVYPYEYMSEPDYLGNLIGWIYGKRPVYVTQGIGFYTDFIGLEAGPFYTVPEGMLFRVATEYPLYEDGDSAWRDPRLPEIFGRQIEDRRNVWWRGIQETMSTMRAYAGYLSLRYGEPERASGYLDQALAIDPANMQAQELVANLEAAAVVLEVEREPKEVRDYLVAAREAVAIQDASLAEENYRKATYLDPTNLEAIEALVNIYELSGMEERAFIWRARLK